MRIFKFHQIKICVLLIIQLLALKGVYAQSTDFMFRHITVKNGLPYPDVHCVIRDHEGFMWIGTANGLFRFDGSRFDVYKHIEGDSTSLSQNTIAAIFDDGDKIICSNAKSISVLYKSTGKFKNYPTPMRTGGDYVNTGRTMIKDNEGFIWIMGLTGLMKFNASSGKIINVKHEDAKPGTITNDTLTMPHFAEDKIRNGFWFATIRGLNFYSFAEKKFYNYLYNPKSWPVFDSRHQQAVVVIRNTLCSFNYVQHTIEITDLTTNLKSELNYPPKLGIKISGIIDLTNVDNDTSGNIYLGTWEIGTLHFNVFEKKFNYLDNESSNPFTILENFTQNVYVDNSGNCWLCHANGISICNVKERKMRVYFPTHQVIQDSTYTRSYIYDMVEDKDTNLWVGTDGFGIWKLNYRTKQFTNLRYKSDSIFHNSIFSFSDNDSVLFAGTRYGLKIINKKDNTVKNFISVDADSTFFHRTIYKSFIDSKRRLWLSNVKTGTYVYDLKTGHKKHFKEDENNPVSIPYKFAVNFSELDSGKIYIQTPKGFCIYNETDSNFSRHQTGELFPELSSSTDIRNMLYDSHHLLWISTFDGYVAYIDKKTGKHHVYNESNGLNTNFINDLKEDHQGNIWIATNISLLRWIRKENRIEKVELNFDQTINDFMRIAISKSGKIYVSNFKAVIEIDPKLIDRGEKLSSLLISRINVFDKQTMVSGNKVELSYKENFFSINYSAPENIFYDNVEYRYMLNGFDKDWVYAKREKTASYTNVPGGDYVFRVQARTANQPWENIERKLNISITKVFYQTWWFRLLLLAMLIVILKYYLNYREKQLKIQSENEAINYFTNSQYGNSTAQEILRDMIRNVISRLDFEDCVIYLLNEDKKVLVQTAGLDNKMKDDYSIHNPIEIPIGRGIVGTVAKTGKAEIINDTTKDERYIVDDQMRLSEIAVPIVHENKVIGVIDSEHKRKHFFTKKHLEQLETIAAICSDKIANALTKKQLQDKELKLLEYDKQVAEIRLMALRAQMNPHFIFNCLNSIDNFILKQQANKASMYLNRFAKLIRLILNQSDKLNTSLQTEMETINYYLELEALRFGTKFEYMITETIEDDTSEIEIPSMVIQPFVENAILHGIMNRESDGGILKINFAQQNSNIICTIEDNGVGRQRAAEIKASRTSVHGSKAMKVTEDRLVLLQQKAAQVASIQITDLHDDNGNANGTRVQLIIPILNDEHTEHES